MVDALHAAHRAVRPGGVVIDLRPDSTHPPRVLRGGRVIGGVYERREAIGDHRASDRAVAEVVRAGLLRPIRTGHFWYPLPPLDLPGLDAFVASSKRLGGYERGTRAAVAAAPDRPVVVRRALAFGIYRRI